MNKKAVNVTHAVIGQYVGLEEIGDGVWDVSYGRCVWDNSMNGTSTSKMHLEGECATQKDQRKVLRMSPD